MREILFRGKRKDNGEWIEGYYSVIIDDYSEEDDCAIFPLDNTRINGDGAIEDYCFVIPETVGQYTGLTDKNGLKIFEGDIIKSCEYDDIYTVKYFGNDNYPAFDCVPEVSNCECNGLSFLVNVEGCEIIGNIYDNPELLKGGTK